jgi:hypothetical protein
MNWVVAFSHVVGGEDVRHTSKLVEQMVLESE